jgi:hypothetical protein
MCVLSPSCVIPECPCWTATVEKCMVRRRTARRIGLTRTVCENVSGLFGWTQPQPSMDARGCSWKPSKERQATSSDQGCRRRTQAGGAGGSHRRALRRRPLAGSFAVYLVTLHRRAQGCLGQVSLSLFSAALIWQIPESSRASAQGAGVQLWTALSSIPTGSERALRSLFIPR